jgi:hypothetical protein
VTLATLGEYTSLLQLGFGIGIGLSLFRAPTDLIAKGLAIDLNAELAVVERVESERARQMKLELLDLNIRLAATVKRLENSYVRILGAAIAAALINWALLALACTKAGYQLSTAEELLLFIVSGPVYLLIGVIVWAWAQYLLLPLRGQLDTIRNS